MATRVQLAPPITKAPYDQFDVSVDFANRKTPGGEALQIDSVTAVDRQGVDTSAAVIMASPAPAVSGTRVVFWVTGGTLGMDYLITVKVHFVTTPPTKWEAALPLAVRASNA
jgi:hypothetical protein